MKTQIGAQRYRAGSALIAAVAMLFVSLLLLADVKPAAAQAQDTAMCIPKASIGQGSICEANDVRIGSLRTLQVLEPCTFAGDTAKVYLRAELISGADARYDIGMFINLDGGSAVDGSQKCARAYLSPITTNPSPTDLSNGEGPFRNLEPNIPADKCGDIQKNDTNFYNLNDAVIEIVCKDNNNDGIVDPVSTLVTWEQNDKRTCASTGDLAPGTSSKCKLGDVTIDLQIGPRDLGIFKDVDKPFALPGEWLQYTLTVQNLSSKPATGVVVTDQLDPLLVNASVVSTSQGSCSIANNLLTCNLGTMAANGTVTIVFKAQVNPALNTVAHIPNTACVAGHQPEPSPDLHPNCDTVVTTTPVTLAFFQATRQGDVTHFEWSTATETNNAGFNLYAETDAGRVLLNEELIPSAVVNSASPQDYSFDVSGVLATAFYIEDVDIFGNPVQHGPFALDEVMGSRIAPEPIDWAAINAEHNAKAEMRATADIAAVNDFLATQVADPIGDAREHEIAERPGFVETDPGTPLGSIYLPFVIGANGSSTSAVEAQAAAAVNPKIQLLVDQTGLYRVTFEQLQAAGFNLAGILASDLALTNQGNAVPMRLVSARRLGPGAYLEFYGVALDTFYTDTNVYLLEINRSKALRAGANTARVPGGTPVPFYMETAAVDNNRRYEPLSPNGDPWYDTQLKVGRTPGSWDFAVEIDEYAAGAAPATLQVNLWGSTDYPTFDPDHHVLIGLNGAAVAESLFNGLSVQTPSVQLAEGIVVNGANTLKLTLPGDTGAKWDLVNLDSYSLTYPRNFVARAGSLSFNAAGSLFRVSGLPSGDVVVYRLSGSNLVRINNVASEALGDGSFAVRFAGTPAPAQYVVSAVSALKTPAIQPQRPATDITSGTADYVMIAHPDFKTGLAPLVQFHQSRGLTVKVVDVTDIYAQFGYGIFGPEGIQRYIAHAVRNMGTRYVLLVGGDTYDYRQYLAGGGISFIPSIYSATGPYTKFAPVDPLYADIDNDRLPDVALGRFPVRSDAELATLIDKTLAYAAKGYGKTAVFAADTGFSNDSERFRLASVADWATQTAYLDQTAAADARSTIVNAINGGVALASFVGHSGPTMWSFKGLFDIPTALSLANAGQPTAVAQWGCWNNYYVDPTYQTLAHAFLVSGPQGAAFSLGSTGLSYALSERNLANQLMPQMTQPGATVGEALLNAQRWVGTNKKNMEDVVIGWTLLGDPAAQVVQ